jgi:uncharacterized protein involved in type VI secretion and phage assembly
MPGTTVVNQIGIKIAGAYLQKSLMAKLIDVEVDTSLYVPSMFAIRFQDDDLSLVDSGPFEISKQVEIELPDTKQPMNLVKVITGEITSIEPEFTEQFTTFLTIRGYDKGHRLNRGTKTRVFQNVSDSDIVKKIAGEAGLAVTATATSPIHEHIFQHNQTDYAFLHERARLNGFELVVIGEMLYFREGGVGDEIKLEWGKELRSFHPRVSVTEQVTKVQVRGWNVMSKQEVFSNAQSSKMSPTNGIGSPESQAAKFSATTQYVEVHQPIETVAEADKLAKSLIAEIDSGFIEAVGTTFGTANLVAGIKVTLSKLGARFSGTYFVTSAVHTYSNVTGYDTHFVVEGVRRRLTTDLVNEGSNPSSALGGVFSALVTQNKDPKNQGRVKLMYPWLDTNLESGWVRISTVGGGNNRGIFWLPEINDEVLVAFEHGNFDQPYILGGLYNGKDVPPATTSQAVPNGAVENHLIQTKKHVITLTEAPAKDVMELKDLSGKTVVRLTSLPQGKIEIICTDREIDIECKQGNVNVTAMTINAKATQAANVSAVNVKIEASGELELKGSIVNMEASGPLKIKGAIVNIN